MVDSGWHILDAIAWLKGLPTSVYCRTGTLKAAGGEYDVDDKAVLAFDFGDGSIGSMTACFVTVPGRYEVRLHGTQGTLELTTNKLVLYPRRGGEPLVVEDDGTDLIAAQFEHFCDVVLDGATPRVGAEQAPHLHAVADAA